VIWLDANDNAAEVQSRQEKLQTITNHVKTFKDVQQCQNYIEERPQSDRLIMIVNGRLGQEIVPAIHKLPQVISIYVYCFDIVLNKKWANKFPKVKLF
jgi:response regulator RpfG family c-di-GMP phosphodiesterase